MKKRICITVSLILLSQPVLLPISASEAGADTRVTVTIAAGGAIGGVFFFLRFKFRGAMPQYASDATALFNHDPEGWKIEYPAVNIMSEKDLKTSPGQHSPETVYVEILKLKF